MAVNWNSAAKTSRMLAGLAQIDADATNPATLEIGAAGMTAVLLVFTLQKPSFSESAGVLSCLGVPLSGVATLTGNAGAARIKDGAGVVVIDGLTVGTTNSDVILNDVSLTTNQGATLQGLTITHA